MGTHTAIRLSPLSDGETARLVSGLLEHALLPAETHQLLLERATLFGRKRVFLIA